jgi:hypothetical protein
VRYLTDLNTSKLLLEELYKIGYKYFIIWDDTGTYLLSTSDYSVVLDTNRYLLESHKLEGRRMASNFDIACYHEQDDDVYEKVTHLYRN